jgi:hypothetical protein
MADATITYLQNTQTGDNAEAYTFSAVNFGAAAAGRYIICCVYGQSATGTISSVSIGGVAATQATSVKANDDALSIYIAAVPTGTSGDVVVTWTAAMGDCGVATYSTSGVGSTTATDQGTSSTASGTTGQTNLTINAGGIGVAISKNRHGATTCSWSQLTEDYDNQDGNTNDISGASKAFSELQDEVEVKATWADTSIITFAAASFPPVTASGPANLKTYNTNAKANIKTINTNLIANVKSLNTNV